MSAETDHWLNTMTLIGHTEQRGSKAWHYRAELQEEFISASGKRYFGNHYPGAIPIEDVRDRLFNWEPESRPVAVPVSFDSEGVPTDWMEIAGKQAIVPSDDPHHVFGIFSESYLAHGYDEWLVGNVAELLTGGPNDGLSFDETLGIASAGLLKERAIAWVELSLPKTFTTPEGVAFRPYLLATTSLDGTVATTYGRKTNLVVCDNTWAGAMKEKGLTYKRKHTRYSGGKMEQDRAREALSLINESIDDVEREIRKLTSIEVTREQFDNIVKGLVNPDQGKPLSKTGETLAAKKTEQITAMYLNDERVSPWNGTAFGVVQAFNTWSQHEKPVRGNTILAERNMVDAVKGNVEKEDNVTWAAIVRELGLTD